MDKQERSSAEEPLHEGAAIQLLPEKPILTSKDMGWGSISADEFCLKANEFNLDPMLEHAICFTLGSSFQLLQERNGQVHEGQSHPGDMAIISANATSRWCWDKVANIFLLRLNTQFVHEVAIQMEWASSDYIEIIDQFSTRDSQTWNIGLLLHLELRGNGSGIKLYAESLATALAVRLLQQHSNYARATCHPSSKLPKVKLKHVIDYIHDHLSDDLALKQLSSIAGVSPNYFANLFKQSIGIPPHQYIIQCRVDRAKSLLLQRKDLTIAEIATLVGFSDQSHLNRHMKRLLGARPKDIV